MFDNSFPMTRFEPALGSNPKHTIYVFSICIIEIVMGKGRK